MLDVKRAHEILGVKEGASKDEILKRYNTLLKKHRIDSQKEADSQEALPSLEEINSAYDLLMGYETGEPEVKQPVRTIIPKPVLRKLKVDERQVNNFFDYHKYHILIGILVVITLVYSLKSCIGQVKPDLNVAYLGDFYVTNTEALSQNIKNSVPESVAVGIDGASISDKILSEQDMAMQQKAMILFAAGDVDVFILDAANFEKFGKQGAFVSLDEMADELGMDEEKNKKYTLKTEEEPAEHLYGIEIKNNSIFNGTGLEKKEKIAAIAVRVKNRENANRLMKILSENP